MANFAYPSCSGSTCGLDLSLQNTSLIHKTSLVKVPDHERHRRDGCIGAFGKHQDRLLTVWPGGSADLIAAIKPGTIQCSYRTKGHLNLVLDAFKAKADV